MSAYQDLIVAHVLAKKLSGTSKKGVEIQTDKKGTTYHICVEAIIN